jgi:hypothetical protein
MNIYLQEVKHPLLKPDVVKVDELWKQVKSLIEE